MPKPTLFSENTYLELERSTKTYTLNLSPLKLYFLYQALVVAKANFVITKPYEELMSEIEKLVYE